MMRIVVYNLLFVLTLFIQRLPAIAQDSVNEDSETSRETESPESNSAPVSTSAATLGGPSSVDAELAEDAREKDSVFEGIDRALKPWFEFKERVNQDVGLKFGLDYSILYQGLTDSLGKDQAAGGVFRVFGNWTLLGRNSSSPGSLVFKGENRHRIGTDVAPQNLGFEAGYVGLTGTLFSDFGWGVTNLFWQQRFRDGKINFIVGNVDPTDYVDIYGLTNPLTHFQNLTFLTNPSIAAPNQGLGIAGGAMLSDNVYLTASLSDANGDPTEAGFDSFFDDGEYFKHIEIAWVSSFERRYFENIHLTAWHVDERDEAGTPDDWGLAFSASWFINDKWMPFLRGGYSQDGAALLDGSVSFGMGRYFANSSNLLGLGVGWGSPAQKGLEDQVTTELFYRLQLAQNLALTPDIQVIFNPALNPNQDAIAVFGIRTRLNL
ncbi:carbohydrate porin [Xenococcus sp. PCC 7305]|uniref:carbohydrate porin n=1 Tax=Xenococcus sp. PCC 7305 TaxID=102125 RepID=UPI00130D7856|nr:carbohydrate porin [Xenococcus sp. PCC 7305]